MLPTRVRFAALPGEYGLSVQLCGNYDCPCTELSIHLRQAERCDGASHEIRVESGTWTEICPPQRPEAEAAMVRECLHDFPESERAAIRRVFEEKRRINEHLKTFHLPPDWGRDGMMVDFEEVVCRAGQFIVDGPLEIVWQFEWADRWYMIVDSYCVNPQCDCREAMLTFYDTTDHVAGRSTGTLGDLFAVRMRLDGDWTLEHLSTCSESTAKMLVMAWQEKKRPLERLRWRYQVMHDIGRRSGRGASARSALALRPLVGALSTPALSIPRARDVGRNDPCPCGSGKKYKKCCGR